MKTYRPIFCCFLSFLVLIFSIHFSHFDLLAQRGGKDEFEAKRYDFQQTAPNIALEHLIVDKIENLGKIGGSYVQAKYLRDDDLVYLKLLNPAVSVGDQFMIYTDNGPVPVPGKYGKQIGRDIFIKGFVEVTKVLPNAVVAKIFTASMNIAIGDSITSPIPQIFKIEPKEPAKVVRGQVLRSAKDLGIIGPYDFVYINRGEKDGLQLNDRLYVYKTAEGVRVIDPNRPPVNVAEIVVVHMADHVATAYVLAAEDSVVPGSNFKSAISEVKFLSDTAAKDFHQAATLNGHANSEEQNASENTDEEDIFAAADRSYLLVGPGLFMATKRDGIHQAHFNFLVEYGREFWAIPLTYGIINDHSQEFGVAPRAQMEFFLFKTIPRLSFIPGAGLAFNYAFDTATATEFKKFQIGLELSAMAKYRFEDFMFVTFSPVVLDLYFYKYLSQKSGTLTSSSSSFDIGGKLSLYLGLGFSF